MARTKQTRHATLEHATPRHATPQVCSEHPVVVHRFFVAGDGLTRVGGVLGAQVTRVTVQDRRVSKPCTRAASMPRKEGHRLLGVALCAVVTRSLFATPAAALCPPPSTGAAFSSRGGTGTQRLPYSQAIKRVGDDATWFFKCQACEQQVRVPSLRLRGGCSMRRPPARWHSTEEEVGRVETICPIVSKDFRLAPPLTSSLFGVEPTTGGVHGVGPPDALLSPDRCSNGRCYKLTRTVDY